ncbi:hypothetical protein [Rhodococcus sp. 06-462-5]|uniref:MmyB family transcriptional regulator n=1 Tax=unclassified Rhodococcus (in: high G+C Gram-positive bacteria) TaxID=192944 RepID=UPI0015C5AF8A
MCSSRHHVPRRTAQNRDRQGDQEDADRAAHRRWDVTPTRQHGCDAPPATLDAAAAIRAVSATHLDDEVLTALVGELSIASAEFKRLWARQDVHLRTGGSSLLDHPEVGPSTFGTRN